MAMASMAMLNNQRCHMAMGLSGNGGATATWLSINIIETKLTKLNTNTDSLFIVRTSICRKKAQNSGGIPSSHSTWLLSFTFQIG